MTELKKVKKSLEEIVARSQGSSSEYMAKIQSLGQDALVELERYQESRLRILENAVPGGVSDDASWPNIEELAALLEEEKYEDLRELADRFGKDEAFLADWHKAVETLVERDIALMTEAEFNMVRDFFLQNANESKRVTILIGIPGSGKSTWAAKQEGATVVNADRYHIGADGVYRYSVANAGKAHLWCYRAFLDALERRDEHIIVDNTNTQNWERSPYVKHAQLCGYTVQFKRFRCPVERAAKRNVHGVSREIIEKMAARIEEPLSRWGEVVEIEAVE